MNQNVFVYGTLQRGESNHRILEQGEAEFVGTGTAEGYLLDLGAFPGAMKGGEGQFNGELYFLPYFDDTIRRLDRLEGNGSFYKREVIEVGMHPHYWTGTEGTQRMSWCYFLVSDKNLRHFGPIRCGCWKNHVAGVYRRETS